MLSASLEMLCSIALPGGTVTVEASWPIERGGHWANFLDGGKLRFEAAEQKTGSPKNWLTNLDNCDLRLIKSLQQDSGLHHNCTICSSQL